MADHFSRRGRFNKVGPNLSTSPAERLSRETCSLAWNPSSSRHHHPGYCSLGRKMLSDLSSLPAGYDVRGKKTTTLGGVLFMRVQNAWKDDDDDGHWSIILVWKVEKRLTAPMIQKMLWSRFFFGTRCLKDVFLEREREVIKREEVESRRCVEIKLSNAESESRRLPSSKPRLEEEKETVLPDLRVFFYCMLGDQNISWH